MNTPLRYNPVINYSILRSRFEEVVGHGPPESIYHYTDAKAMGSIINTGQLWAFHIRQLNDAEEVTYGREILHKRIQAWQSSSSTEQNFLDTLLHYVKRRRRFGLYSISFSTLCDDTSMYQRYPENTAAPKICAEFSPRELGIILPVPIQTFSVVYDRAQQLRLMDQLLQDTISQLAASGHSFGSDSDRDEEFLDYARSVFEFVFPLFKDGAQWRTEAEYRIVINRQQMEAVWGKSPEIQRLPDNRPYLKVPAYNTSRGIKSLTPLKTIYVHSSSNNATHERNLRTLLQQHNSHVEVKRSTSSLRI